MAETSAALPRLADYADGYRERVFNEVLAEFDLSRDRLLDADPRTSAEVFGQLYPRGRIDAGDAGRSGPSVADGAAKLAEREGNPFRWVGREVADHGRLSTLYAELVAIDGVGRRIAHSFLRDAVWVCGAESRVRVPDRHHLQPISAPVDRVAASLWPELDGANADVLADHVATACADADVSAVAFNQGAWYVGRAVGDAGHIDAEVRNLRRDAAIETGFTP